MVDVKMVCWISCGIELNLSRIEDRVPLKDFRELK